MIVLTAKGTGICLDHDNMMFLAKFGPGRTDGMIGSYVDRRGNIQPVMAKSVYGEQMIAAIAKWEEETGK